MGKYSNQGTITLSISKFLLHPCCSRSVFYRNIKYERRREEGERTELMVKVCQMSPQCYNDKKIHFPYSSPPKKFVLRDLTILQIK